MPKYEIGQIVGTWKIIGINPGDRHGITYIGKCINCGYVNPKLYAGNISKQNKNPKFCNHLRNKWYSNRLGVCYRDMIKRCYNKNDLHYQYYGARGIRVCDEWRNNKLAFNDWAINNGYTDELTIDRIDNNGNYCPENCRWVTKHFNMTHKRGNRHLTYNGITMTPFEWSQKLKISKHAFYDKCLVQPIEEVEQYLADVIEGRVIYKPRKTKKRLIKIDGVKRPLKEWATMIGWTKKKLSDHFTTVGKKKCRDTIKRLLKQQKDSLVIRFGND